MGSHGNTSTKADAAPFNHSVFASSELMQRIDIIEYTSWEINSKYGSCRGSTWGQRYCRTNSEKNEAALSKLTQKREKFLWLHRTFKFEPAMSKCNLGFYIKQRPYVSILSCNQGIHWTKESVKSMPNHNSLHIDQSEPRTLETCKGHQWKWISIFTCLCITSFDKWIVWNIIYTGHWYAQLEQYYFSDSNNEARATWYRPPNKWTISFTIFFTIHGFTVSLVRIISQLEDE